MREVESKVAIKNITDLYYKLKDSNIDVTLSQWKLDNLGFGNNQVMIWNKKHKGQYAIVHCEPCTWGYNDGLLEFYDRVHKPIGYLTVDKAYAFACNYYYTSGN